MRSKVIIDKVHVVVTLGLLAVGLSYAQIPAMAKPLVSYTVQRPERVEPGAPFLVGVRFAIENGWYIYAPTGTNAAQGMIETKVIFSLPVGITRSGKMEIPEPVYKNGYEVLEGNNVTMSQPLNAAKPGQYEIRGKGYVANMQHRYMPATCYGRDQGNDQRTLITSYT